MMEKCRERRRERERDETLESTIWMVERKEIGEEGGREFIQFLLSFFLFWVENKNFCSTRPQQPWMREKEKKKEGGLSGNFLFFLFFLSFYRSFYRHKTKRRRRCRPEGRGIDMQQSEREKKRREEWGIKREREGKRKESRQVNGMDLPFYSQLGWFGLFCALYGWLVCERVSARARDWQTDTSTSSSLIHTPNLWTNYLLSNYSSNQLVSAPVHSIQIILLLYWLGCVGQAVVFCSSFFSNYYTVQSHYTPSIYLSIHLSIYYFYYYYYYSQS